MVSGTQGDRTLYFYSMTRFHYDSDGELRTFNALMEQEKWRPFLNHFSRIVIHARIDTRKRDDRGHRFDDPRVSVVAIPFYSGTVDFILKYFRIRRFIASKVSDPTGYYAMWVPNPIAPVIARRSRRMNAPLLTIATGDPDGVARSIFPAPFNRILAWFSARSMRYAVSQATGAVYVSLTSLQRLYPAASGALTLARTNFKLALDSIDFSGKSYENITEQDSLSLVTVGSQEKNYKGHDLLIEAVASLQLEGYRLKLTIIGNGMLHETLVAQARALKVENATFIKQLPTSEEVAREIANHDIFLMPSRTEGMPKALLEAMSVGVFALGARVGGIPEVLDSECVFETNSAAAISERVRHFMTHRERIEVCTRKQRETVSNIQEHHSGDAVLERFLETWITDSEETYSALDGASGQTRIPKGREG